MSDIRKLKKKLSKLAATEVDGKRGVRVVACTDAADCLRKILDEIDETVLPHDLLLQSDAGVSIALTAKNRRLVRLNPPVARELAPLSDVFGQDLSSIDDAQKALLRDLFGRFCSDAKILSIASAETARGEVSDEIGLTATQLGSGIFENVASVVDSENVELLQSLLDALEGKALAWLLVGESGMLNRGGSTACQENLEAVAARALPHIRNVDDGTDRQDRTLKCWVLGARKSSEMQTVMATHGSEALVMALQGNAAPDLMAAWRAVTR